MLAAATEEARAEVTAKLMKAHDRAHMRWYKEEYEKVRAEVEAEYEALRVVGAFRIVSGRETSDGEPVTGALEEIKVEKAARGGVEGGLYGELRGGMRGRGGVGER